jgi:hypothetical protein
MSRQLDLKEEERETAKRTELVKALEFGIVGSLQIQGIQFLGLSITYDDFYVRCVVKAVCEERRLVSFVTSDSMINVLLLVYRMANNHKLMWGTDKYYTD